MQQDMESAHIDIQRDLEERVTYGMLLEAAIQGKNMEVLLRLLQDDRANLHRVMWECRGKDNPLHVGALYGNVDFVREILNRKPELTRELNSEGLSPLHLASARGHVDVVREIFSQDADACLTPELNSEGQSPLHLASEKGHVEVVKEILSKDAYACLTRELNSKGKSPLHLASERGHVKVVREILSKDGDACFIRDLDGMIPLHLAAIKGRVEVLEELVKAEKITVFILTKSGEPILHLCAINNEFKALKKLIEFVKDDPGFVNLRDSDHSTILHLLSARGNYQVIKLLLKNAGVNVNAENVDGFTPLEVSLLHTNNPWDDCRIQLLLTEAGAKTHRMQTESLLAGLRRNIEMPGKDESRFGEALMVVAILMATVAFQAGLSPPGGVWPDTTFHNATLPNVTQASPPPTLVRHYAGKSIVSYVDPRSYESFSICNGITLALSLLVIQMQLASYLFKSTILQFYAVLFTSLSLVTMSVTYYTSATYISLHKQLILILVLISSIILYFCLGFWSSGILFKFRVLASNSTKSRRKAQT
ncbi:hypothetical protein AAC387_Pa07g0429 [Persea americana]